MRLVTLLTDFGLSDSYVAQMKAVLLSSDIPDIEIVDVSHDVPRHDVREASCLLHDYARHFPQNTVHLVVVDPGVGSARRRIVAKLSHAESSYVVGPDNGFLSLLAHEGFVTDVWEIINLGKVPHRRGRSNTFDGRDVFSPVALFLLNGHSPELLGPRLEVSELRTIPGLSFVEMRGESVAGEVLRFDHFGNAITNLRVSGPTSPSSAVVGSRKLKVCSNYSEIDEAACIVGSSQLLEVSAREADVRTIIDIKVGTPIQAMFD